MNHRAIQDHNFMNAQTTIPTRRVFCKLQAWPDTVERDSTFTAHRLQDEQRHETRGNQMKQQSPIDHHDMKARAFNQAIFRSTISLGQKHWSAKMSRLLGLILLLLPGGFLIGACCYVHSRRDKNFRSPSANRLAQQHEVSKLHTTRGCHL